MGREHSCLANHGCSLNAVQATYALLVTTAITVRVMFTVSSDHVGAANVGAASGCLLSRLPLSLLKSAILLFLFFQQKPKMHCELGVDSKDLQYMGG